jgi:hypothetical protein
MSFTTSFEKFKILFLASIVPLVMNVTFILLAEWLDPLCLLAVSPSLLVLQVVVQSIDKFEEVNDFLKSCAVGMALGLTYFSACCAAIWAGHRYLHQGNNAMTVCITVVTESSCVVTMLNVMLTLSIHAFKRSATGSHRSSPRRNL